MPRNDDGEFELILGNKQLLSVFFIVVTLLAVFFAMGFIMGRSVNPVAEARKVDNGPSEKPIVVDAKPSPTTTASSTRPVEIKSPIEAEVKKDPEPKTKAQEPAKKNPEPPKAEVKKPEPPPTPATKPGTPGTYLQVGAVGKNEADLMSEVLAKKGFRTMIANVEGKPDLHRVLVGPVQPGAEQAKAMDDLRALGFKGIFPRKM